MTEVWKPIEGYEGIYEVSSFGRVRSLGRTTNNRFYPPKVMKQQISKGGYLRMQLCRDNVRVIHLLHRLVARAFVDGYFEGAEVNHKDENKLNNRADNLEWCTGSYNTRYNNLQERRYNNGGGRRKRPVNQYTLDGKYIRTFASIAEAQKETGAPQKHITAVCRGYPKSKSAKGYRWKYADEE